MYFEALRKLNAAVKRTPKLKFMPNLLKPPGRYLKECGFKYSTSLSLNFSRHPLFSISLWQVEVPIRELYLGILAIADSTHVAYFVDPTNPNVINRYLHSIRRNGITPSLQQARLASNQIISGLMEDSTLETRIQIDVNIDERRIYVLDGAHRAAKTFAHNNEDQIQRGIPILWCTRG